MTTVSWKQTGGSGNWSTASNWTPAPPASGDSVVIGTTRNTAPIVVTDNVSTAVQTLTLAARAAARTELVVLPADGLTVNGGVVIGPYSSIDGSGTLIANGAISGTGTIIADGGLLDLAGSGSIASGGPALAIGTTVPSTLEVNLPGGASARMLAINNANQTLEVGPAGALTLTTALNVSNGSVLMAGGTLGGKGISFGGLLTNGSLSGFGTVTANLSRSGIGSADMITAVGGTLDLEGRVNAGLILAIDSVAPATLKIDSAAQLSGTIAISNANQTLEIGAAGSLRELAGETITSGTIRLDGGGLSDPNGFGIGAGATLTGTGTVSGGYISGTGSVIASGGVLNLKSAVNAAGTHFTIGSAAGSVLELSSGASGATFTFAGPTGTLELANVSSGIVRGFSSVIAGLNVGASGAVPTNDIDIQAPVTSATLSGNQIKVLSGTKTVATLLLNAAPAAGARAFVQADATLGGYDVFLASPAAPTVSWSPASVTGTEPGPLALGTITALAGGAPLGSVLVGNIPVGATLADGAGHSFLASASTTSVNVLGWSYGNLTLAAPNDSNVSLSVQASDTLGDSSAVASEALVIDPLAPTVAPAAVAGSTGQPIALNLGIIVNKMAGDTNSLSSVTLTGIPAGATLSNSAGALTPSGGAISFNAAQLAAGALGGLAINSPTPGPIALGVTAMEQDANGDVSATAAGSETVTVAPPAPSVTWASPTDGIPGYAHIVVVMEENHDYGEIIGSPQAPYINSLAAGGALLSNYSAITHPSEPNYFALYAGSTFGISDDNVYVEPDPTMATILQGAGKSFVGYVEHPDASYDHNPWESFPEGTSVEQDFSTFPASGNFASLPTVSFVTPNTQDDMHDGTVAQADSWLQTNIDAYAQWAKANNSLLVVDSDESDTSPTNQVVALLYGANVIPGVYSTAYNHYNMLNTILGASGLTAPRSGADATPIDVFNTGAAAVGVEGEAIGLGTITPSGTGLTAVSISGIPVNATVSDGTNSFTATAGTTSVNVLGWNYGSLTITPANDTNFLLSVQVTDGSGQTSVAANQAVTVDPEAATVSPVAASGAIGRAIALNLGLATNGMSGDANSLSSVTIGGIPVGATLSNSSGALAVSNGSITISAGQLAAGVLNGLAITPASGGTFSLNVSATEQDGNGDASTTTVGQAVITAAGGRVIDTSVPGPIALAAGDNPVTITSTGTVTSVGAGQDGIDGSAGTAWDVANNGTVSSGSGVGISLAGSGTIANAGSIAGNTGIILRSGGAVSNASAGSISASGTVGGGFAIGAGIYITGAMGTATNYGAITGGGYGIAMAAGGSITNFATITGGEDAVIVTNATGTLDNHGRLVATVDDGVGLFAGGGVSNAAGAFISGAGTLGAGVFITGGTGTVSNAGSIQDPNHIGILIASGGTVTNSTSGAISGSDSGVFFELQPGTLRNAGTISSPGPNGTGVYLENAGAVTNVAGGVISGARFGAFVEGGFSTVDNYGSILGGTYDGIVVGLGGSVTNASGGLISGGSGGVYVKYRAAGTVTNFGSINGANGAGIDLADGGSVNNDAGAAVTGGDFGVFITGASGVVTNSGSIGAAKYGGVELVAGGTLTNASDGAISGGSNGVYVEAGGTVVNSGSITATSASGAGASLLGGSLSNSVGAAISGASFGVFVTGVSGTVTNAGTLTGSHGVALEAGGTLSNAASGSIVGQVSGVFSQGGAAMVANYGSISAGASGGAGADIEAGGSINNFASASITGTSFGVFVTGGPGSVSNAGSIGASSNIGIQLSDGGSVNNMAGATINGAGYGIVIDGGGTVTNAGTILGTPAAVKFSGAGNDRVVMQPGAVFNGAVVGGSGTNTVELAAGSGAISMAPGLFNGFGTVVADGGSNWTLTNADTTASELFQLDSASTLDVAAALGTNAQFSFLGASDLVVADTSTFGTAVGSSAYAGPLLEGFGAADAIDLANFSAVGAMATLSSGTGLLQLSNGSAQVASLSFQTSSLGSGTFQLGPDHSGGIILTLS